MSKEGKLIVIHLISFIFLFEILNFNLFRNKGRGGFGLGTLRKKTEKKFKKQNNSNNITIKLLNLVCPSILCQLLNCKKTYMLKIKN